MISLTEEQVLGLINVLENPSNLRDEIAIMFLKSLLKDAKNV